MSEAAGRSFGEALAGVINEAKEGGALGPDIARTMVAMAIVECIWSFVPREMGHEEILDISMNLSREVHRSLPHLLEDYMKRSPSPN